MTHDPLCFSDDDPYNCDCDLIAKVRADERNRRNVARELTQLAQGMGMIP